MQTLNYTLRFLTPAFLGNAEQNAQWRTPPIKHLLREWWRVAYAAEHGFNVDVAAMRHEEGVLFGHAWLENDQNDQGKKVAARKSLLRMRLGSWTVGKLQTWPTPDMTVAHPEVPKPVGSQLYLGYGPLKFDKGTVLKANAAIQPNEAATLSLAVPDDHWPRINHALFLMARYGALGGRSRNGWGSFSLLALPLGDCSGEDAQLARSLPLRNWRDCLGCDWPHAIGQDDHGPLIWQTAPHDDWRALMKTLAIIKIGLRTQFAFTTGKNAASAEDRHWLSYPVTNHSVRPWGNNARLPNTLRFKVREVADGKLVGVIYHAPCLPPASFGPDRQAIERVWRRVHQFLGETAQSLIRISE